jgi:hypothetical protein
MDFKEKTYHLNDILKKRKYLLERTKEIYPKMSEAKINDILDKITIEAREQKEKGASNHETKEIFISYKELNRRNINNEESFITYLEGPYSPIIHEVTHIFQNINKEFPNVQYNEKKDGKYVIDYKKYVTDPGEIQARLEHIIELLNWGFTKEEIVSFLYSRAYNDQAMWRDLVDKAEKIRNEN